MNSSAKRSARLLLSLLASFGLLSLSFFVISNAAVRQEFSSAIGGWVRTDRPESSALEQPAYRLNLDEEGRALRGYDAVAYFETGQAQRGDRRFTATWQGAQWYFSSLENRRTFLADPKRFVPSNGGYCTFGIVLEQKLDGDPSVWLIDQGKLYVFLNPEVKQKFLQDRAANFTLVAQNWPKIADAAPELLN